MIDIKIFGVFLAGIAIVAIFVGITLKISIWFGDVSTEAALMAWQKESGYVIVAKRYRILKRGPFKSSSGMQVVYRLEL